MSGSTPQVIVVGGGPAGLAAACILAADGVSTALVAAESDADPRTVAIMQPGLRLLRYLEIWPGALAEASAPLQKLRLVDDTGSAFNASELTFDARELELDAFGWNVPLQKLIESLRRRAHALGVTVIAGEARSSRVGPNGIDILLADGASLQARLCIAADGARSALRKAAGIESDEWSYDQAALATSFAHSAPHDGISTEYYKAGGPMTTVPLPDHRSSLVWMDRPERIARFHDLADDRLAAEIQVETHGQLGRVSAIGARKVIAMKGLTARRFAANRTLLIGEAAHVVPPIGAQGLNMSLRDAGLAADLILAERDDPGAARVLVKFDAERRRQVIPRQAAVDAMNRSLLFSSLAIESVRALGLGAVGRFDAFRRAVMTIGMGDDATLPFAMRH